MSVILGIIILVVDALWIYSSFPHFSTFAGGFPVNGSAMRANFTYPNATMAYAFRNTGYSGYIGIIYGAIILVVDLVWIFMSLGSNANRKKK